jgi:hypothetical protein
MKREECNGVYIWGKYATRERVISADVVLGGKYEKSRETEGKYERNVRKRSDNGKRYPYLRGKI